MIFHLQLEADSTRNFVYLREIYQHQELSYSKNYAELIFRDGKKQIHYKRDFCEVFHLICYQQYPEDLTAANIGLHMRKTKKFNKHGYVGGIGVIGFEVNLINAQLLPLNFSTLGSLPLFQEFPPTCIIHVSPEQLLAIYCLKEFFKLTPSNINLMNQFYEKFTMLQHNYFGYSIKPIIDLDYIIPIPGFLSLKDAANPFRVQIYDYENGQIIQTPAVIYIGEEPLLRVLRGYSIKRFLSYVGLTVESYDDVIFEETISQYKEAFDGTMYPLQILRR